MNQASGHISSNFCMREIVKKILNEEMSLNEISNMLPCFLHINSLEDFSVLETDEDGAEYIGSSSDEFKELGFDFLQKLVPVEDLNNAIEANKHYLDNLDTQDNVSFLQRIIPIDKKKDTKLYYTKGKVIDHNRILNISIPIENLEYCHHRSFDLFNHAQFIKRNITKFNELTKREVTMCKFLCQSDSMMEVASYFQISINTLKNHRRNIYRKMSVSNYFDFYNFCSKFKIHV